MHRLRTWLPGLALVAYLILLLQIQWLWSEEPPQIWQELPGGVPSVTYLPGPGPAWPPPPPPPAGERPAPVLLLHGYSGDQIGMGALARSLARAGYAVMTIDLRGHGSNRNPHRGNAGQIAFREEIDAAVAALRDSPYVDAARLVVMGHSMGAGAVLGWAERHAGPSATVLIAGGWELLGPGRPANALFLVAENELPGIASVTQQVAARLAGVPAVTEGTTYGRIERGDAVRWTRVPDTDHARIIRDAAAFAAILDWIDAATGTTRAQPVAFHDPYEGPSSLAFLAILLVLPGIAEIMARLARRPDAPTPGRVLAALALPAAALALALALARLGGPGLLLGISDGDQGATLLAVTGLLLVATLVLRGRLELALSAGDLARDLGVAALGFVAVYSLGAPNGVVLRGFSLSPERFAVLLAGAVACFPFAYALHFLTRGGGTGRGVALSVGARLLLAVLLVGAVSADWVWFSTRVWVVSLLPTWIMLELVFAAFYATSRNVRVAAAFESLWVGWILAVSLPIGV